ncbi:MAG: cytochrome c [Planctomycetaceae bacterium]|jgi:hypothetical protein|nr:cytochrome c [Planctomycetaceae bacterium]MBT7917543.1 cytochrome c [Planctomycetaceae bacterium]
MKSTMRRHILMIGLIMVVCPVLFVLGQSKPKPKRVKFPEFKDDARIKTVFFSKALEKLAGPRQINTAPMAGVGNTGAGGSEPETGGMTGKWAELISAPTIEDEVKAIKLAVDTGVDKPSQFSGGGYQNARYQFSVAAAMFGIIAEFDGDVRWKSQALGIRDVFARTAGNCKVGSTQAYNEAKLRKADLQDLLGGATVDAKANAEDFNWSRVVDRAPLMQRLEVALDERLSPMTSSADEFESNKETILHEAEIVAAMAHIFTRPQMEDGDDEDYAGYAKKMKSGALDLLDAVKLNDPNRAASAVGVMTQSCTECHELYRS